VPEKVTHLLVRKHLVAFNKDPATAANTWFNGKCCLVCQTDFAGLVSAFELSRVLRYFFLKIRIHGQCSNLAD